MASEAMEIIGHSNGISLLRGMAAFGIVGCHLSLLPRTEGGFCVTSLCDLNVGVFAALAGYLMAKSRHCGWWEYSKKRMRRLLPAYFVWTVVFLVAATVFQYLGAGVVKPRYAELRWWLSVCVWGGAAAHLWFLVSLLYAQILLWPILPRLRMWVCFALSLLLVSFSVFSDNWYVVYPIRLLAFLLLGCGLSGVRLEGLEQKRAWLLAFAAMAIGLYFVRFPFAVGFLRDWIAAGPILLIFAGMKLPVRVEGMAAMLGATSMGVYLAHPIFTRVWSVGVERMFQSPYGVVPILLAWGLSWLCAFLVTVLALRGRRLRKWFL